MTTVEALTLAIARDQATHEHTQRVRTSAVSLARAFGVTDEAMIDAIDQAALLHDVGKLAVPPRICNKPGRLTNSEFEVMKQHVDIGVVMLSRVPLPEPVVPIVGSHHENWNGTGYPRGLQGREIPLGARILAVADCFDALTSDRPYRSRLDPATAMDIVVQRSGTMYDPDIVDTFVTLRGQTTH
jgi:putative nucleotidyltransferase with HDIG domain